MSVSSKYFKTDFFPKLDVFVQQSSAELSSLEDNFNPRNPKQN